MNSNYQFAKPFLRWSLGVMTLLVTLSGCAQTLHPKKPISTSDGPPSIDFAALGIAPEPEETGSSNDDQSESAASPKVPSEGVRTTVRGQSPVGFGMPPMSQQSSQPDPGGSGHSRGPLPVSGSNVRPALGQDFRGASPISSQYYGNPVQQAQFSSPFSNNDPPSVTGSSLPRVAQNGAPPVTQSPAIPTPGVAVPQAPYEIGTTPGLPPTSPPPVNSLPQTGVPAGVPPTVTTVPGTTIVNQPPQGANIPLGGQPLGNVGAPIEPLSSGFNDQFNQPPPPVLQPRVRTVPVDVYVTPARTGRFMIGGAVNSDAGLTGQIVLDERNFDIMRWPRSFQDLFSGYAFRGAGQTFRLEAVPGSDFQRYMVSFGQPYLFGYLPFSLSMQGFLFDRRYRDWDESRGGGRMQLGYRITNQLSISTAIRAESVDFNNVRLPGNAFVDSFVGKHELYSGSVRLTHDTRDIPFAPTEGHLLELTYEQVFGSFEYSRWNGDWRQYFLLRQRADGSGRHTLAFTNRLGISGDDTPIFENYFAGGYSTIRGFDFRGASPILAGMQVGGRFSLLSSVEYQFPITADDATRGVLFLDYGTVERNVTLDRDNFRVVPGFGFRVSMPALGPAPLAFDFGFPVAYAPTDDRQVFSFFMGFSR